MRVHPSPHRSVLALLLTVVACAGGADGEAPCLCGPHATCRADGACACDAGFVDGGGGACVAAGCPSDAACDDGDPCNGVEACVDRACVAGAPVACQGGQRCTPAGTCACPPATWEDGGTCRPIGCTTDAACDNGDPCDGLEACSAELICEEGTPVACGAHATCDGGACACATGYVGDPAAGCVPAECTSDAACDDGDPCTGVEACDAATGTCRGGTAVACGAHATCGADGACACDAGHHGEPAVGCVADECEDAAACDDGDPCTGVEACVGFACQPGTPVACTGGQACNAFGVCACPIGTVAGDQGGCVPPQGAIVADGEGLPVDASGVWNGADGSGGVADGLAFFGNTYSAEYASWEGFAVSTRTDTTTPGWGNQYSAFPGSGAEGSDTWLVAYAGTAGPPTVTFPGSPDGVWPTGVFVANTTYAALSMRDGDDFAKKFGGVDGSEPDWFRLTFTGHDAGGAAVGSVEVYLADFRGGPADDFILDTWAWVDLGGLGPISSLTLAFDGSDVGAFGLNTPAYAALDGLTVHALAAATAGFDALDLGQGGAWTGADGSGGVLEAGAWFGNSYDPAFDAFEGFAFSNHTDTTTPGWDNHLSAIPGGGAEGSDVYAVSYGSAASWSGFQPYVSFTGAGEGVWPDGAFVTNTTYAYLSMRDGDAFAKKFGGPDGSDPDWFRLSVSGVTAEGATTGPVELYLADYRAADPAGDVLLDQWTWLDLRPLGRVTGLLFDLSSSDTGDWGLNTPAYFALDGLRLRAAR